MEAKKTRYTTLDVIVPSRELGTPDPWHCFIMVVPRQSFLMFWDVLDLYKNLKLICYGNDAGTWAHRARRSMQNHMLHAGLAPEANMLGSVRALQGQSNNAEVEVADEGSRFCLPTFALSTPAFLAVLAKMGHSTPQQGGLITETCQRFARSVFGDLMQALTKTGGLSIHIRCMQDTILSL